MLDDHDIQNYLGMIRKSQSAGSTRPEAGSSAPSAAQPAFFIHPSCDVRDIERIKIGNNVVIQKDCWLNIAFDNPSPGPMIEIGEGTDIGRRCTISAANKISIGRHVLFAPNVFVADTHHSYQKLGIPIMHQGISTHTDSIVIGDESWIGINAVIMGDVTIGKHCVIGANSVINKDVPDYCVVAGNPAKILKVLDVESGRWISVNYPLDCKTVHQVVMKNSFKLCSKSEP